MILYIKNIPKHVAIIMDGNGRWAKLRGKSRIFGHKVGVRSLKKIIDFSISFKLNILTLYAFSTENWSRPYFEVLELMKLFNFSINNQMNNLHKNNVCVKIIGDRNKLPLNLCKNINKIEYLTKHNNGLKLNIAINYGGKWDIIYSIKKIFNNIKNNLFNINEINEEKFSKYLCLSNLHPVDLLIRTGGEKRISNFLLWQIAYSELFFTDILWPDFKYTDFLFILNDFSKRKRRFGKI